MTERFFLPVLHSFENGNVYTGSRGPLRFKITPSVVMLRPKEVDFAQSSLRAEVWHGEYCYEKSEIEREQVFPLSEEGLEALQSWLMEQTA